MAFSYSPETEHFARNVKRDGIQTTLRSEERKFQVQQILLATGESRAIRFLRASPERLNPDRPTILILPGTWEDPVAYSGYVEGLKNDYDVISLDYMGFSDLASFTQGTKQLLHKLDIKNLVIFGTSLGGLLMQHLSHELKQDESITVQALFASHTTSLESPTLNQVMFRGLQSIPKPILWEGYKLSTIAPRRKLRQLPQLEDVTENEILAAYANAAIYTRRTAITRDEGYAYLNLLRQARTTKLPEIPENIPVLQFVTPDDMIMNRNGHADIFAHNDVEVIKLPNGHGHESPRYAQLQIIGAMLDFLRFRFG